jgi:hypothetical protein
MDLISVPVRTMPAVNVSINSKSNEALLFFMFIGEGLMFFLFAIKLV